MRPKSLIAEGPSTLSYRQDADEAPVPTGTGFVARAAAVLAIAVQYCTRSGSPFSNVSRNPNTVRMMRFAGDGAILWLGNNGLMGGATPTQEIEALVACMDQLIAHGVRRFYVTLGMPRSSLSTDDWATSIGQTTSSGFGFLDNPLRLSRLIAELGRTRPNVLVMPFPDVRARDDITKWRGASPRYCDLVGTHPEKPANILMAADFVDALDTYADWPTLQANMALSCTAANRPAREDCDALADFVTNAEAAGITFFAGPWWGNAPLENGDDLRRVDGGCPGRWNLFTNPDADGDTSIDYSPHGTGSKAGVGYLRPGMVPSSHWPLATMTTDVGFYVWFPDCADQFQIFSTNQAGADSLTAAWIDGVFAIRLNAVAQATFPCKFEPGFLYVQRRGGNIVEAWFKGAYLGARSQNLGSRSSGGLRFFDPAGATTFTRRRFALAGFVQGSLTDSQVQTLTAEATALVAYGRARNLSASNWHPLADQYFDTMKELGIEPTDPWKTWYNGVIEALDNAGYLSALDYVTIHHGHHAKVGLLNFIRPRNLSTIDGGTDTSSISFTAKSGSLFSTLPIASDVGPYGGATDIGYGRGLNMVQDNHSLIWRGEINGQSNPITCGALELGITPRSAASPNQILVRSASLFSVGVVPTGSPLTGAHTIGLDRSKSTEVEIYADGGMQGSPIARTSSAFTSPWKINVGRRSGGDSPGMDTTQKTRWVLAAASLGEAGQAAIHAILAAADAAMPS